MEYNVEILRLSNMFYADYSSARYPELLKKAERPYACLMIRIRDYYICIPFSKTKPIHEKEFLRKYKYSTVPYFHDTLGLPN